jgi:uncharacterized protein YdhG (YjbR/CyaY superfamily)
MNYDADSVEEYIKALPENRRNSIKQLRNIILSNLPEGFFEQISYGMISYVVPISKYPRGYHAKRGEPLPFLALASQKNYISLYHMGMYSNAEVKVWFINEYAKRVPTKLDMGKSCIRFKNGSSIPYDLIAELCRKITVDDYINSYEQTINRK